MIGLIQRYIGVEMSREEPVRTISDFRTLDDGEVLEGYLDGFSGTRVMIHTRSRSYLHGWRNGMIESERLPPDDAYDELRCAFEARRVAH
jgi:hypothetical protein